MRAWLSPHGSSKGSWWSELEPSLGLGTPRAPLRAVCVRCSQHFCSLKWSQRNSLPWQVSLVPASSHCTKSRWVFFPSLLQGSFSPVDCSGSCRVQCFSRNSSKKHPYPCISVMHLTRDAAVLHTFTICASYLLAQNASHELFVGPSFIV